MDSMTIKATDGAGSFKAFHAAPEQPIGGAVVLIQEIFGVSDSIKQTARDIAAQGYHVLAPDLFWRIRPGVNLSDKTEAEWKEAFALMNQFDQQKGVDDLKATLAAARAVPGTNGRAGTIGYCLGGRLAMMMAEQSDADVNVSYYGVQLDNLLDGLGQISKPLMLHIAEKDQFFPAEGRQKVVAAAKDHPHIKAYTYADADHAFARSGGAHFQARAAAIANGRSAEALEAALA